MKKLLYLLFAFTSFVYSQTTITNANFQTAINTCLTTNPIDGLCSDSEYGSMPDWDVSNVTSMSDAFKDKNSFNADISSWDVSKVTDMSGMFYYAPEFNQDLSSWDVSKVTSMSGMFQLAGAFNQDLSSWDVSNVTEMSAVFADAFTFNQDLRSWNVSNVNTMSGMFVRANKFNGDISTWDVSNVTDMSGMFQNAFTFNQDLSSWNVSNVADLKGMFVRANKFNGDISTWDVSNVTDMSLMFKQATSFDQDLSSWDVSQVVYMTEMFSGATSFSQDLSSWDVNKVVYMLRMFKQATSFDQDLSSWDVSQVAYMTEMFSGATSFNQDLSSWDVSNVIAMRLIFNISGLSTENYDNVLIGWSQLTLQQNVVFGAEGITYCNGKAARQSIIDNYGWTITDFGEDCNMELCSPEPGDYSIRMIDNYGDGWQGSGITVTLDGVSKVFAIDDYWDADPATRGSVGDIQWIDVTETVTIPTGTLEAIWEFVSGSYPSEVEFEIFPPDGTSFGYFGPAPTPGLLPIINASEDCVTASLEALENTLVTIYPNPTTDFLSINGNQNPVNINIYNVLGKEVLSAIASNKVNVKSLPNGVYVIRIKDGLKEVIKKFIKN
jgi:surface protein